MSEQYIKLQSQQNGNFTPTNNRVDFIIPASYGKISLKDSFIQVYCQMNSVSAANAGGQATYMSSLGWKNGANKYDNHFNNVALVRNAHVSSANKGMIESVRRTDILRQNMSSFRQSQTAVDSNRYLSANSLTNLENEQRYGLWNDINKTGSVQSSTNNNTPIQIRLGDILDFCNSDVIDMASLGDTRIHLELNLDNVEGQLVYPAQLANAQKFIAIPQPAAALDVTQLSTLAKYSNLNQSGYWVGQELEIDATVNGTANTISNGIVKEIIQSADGSLTITFNQTIMTLTTTGGGATAIVIDNVEPLSPGPTAQFSRMEAVLKVMPAGTETVGSVLYTQFDTYELLGNGATSYTNVVEIDGSAENAIIMPVDANGLDAKLVVGDFRIACNNVELTDSRSVIPYTPLYYDRFVAAMTKSDYVVNNLQNPLFATDEIELYTADKTQIIAMPLFQTQGRKNLQVNINSAGLDNFVLYTAIPRVLEL
jgi:hypothetical protein